MFESMRRLAALPGDTKIYFGHEYTINNLDFVDANLKLARAPDDLARAVASYRSACRARLDRDLPTTPSRIETEKAINPFLAAADVPEFGRWREARNHWGT